MPWISVAVTEPPADADDLARSLAEQAAQAAGLLPEDIVVIITVAAASSGRGAVVNLAGRRRSEDVEAAMADAVRHVVSQAIGVDPDLVALLRS